MNSTQTLIVARLHEMYENAMAETERIVANPKFNPAEAGPALARAKALREAKEEVERMVMFRG